MKYTTFEHLSISQQIWNRIRKTKPKMNRKYRASETQKHRQRITKETDPDVADLATMGFQPSRPDM